jgi:hypothetical protein
MLMIKIYNYDTGAKNYTNSNSRRGSSKSTNSTNDKIIMVITTAIYSGNLVPGTFKVAEVW